MSLILSSSFVLLLIFARKFWSTFGNSWKSPLRSLPGPKSASYFLGNFGEIHEEEHSVLFEKWVIQYGKTFKYYGLGNIPQLFTMDTRALEYILSDSERFHKSETARVNLTQVLGEGILVVEGEKHRQQRRIMNPAFGPMQIRALVPLFHQKSIELRDVLLSQIPENGTDREITLDVVDWLGRATLDIIGLAGFGYSFDALASDDNELSKAFHAAMRGQMSLLPFFQAWMPILQYIPTERGRLIAHARAVMKRIGMGLIEERKVVTETNSGKDLLSLSVQANLKDKERMSDDDVLAQVPTFLVAGHETTATAITWALYSLALNPDIQNKLRNELFSLDSGAPSVEEIKTLTYLDYIVKETLRIHPPIANVGRVAANDDLVPLEDGSTVRVGKGDFVFIPILAVNRAKDIWGEDSFEFRPERWGALPDKVSAIPGVWAHLLSFLGGSRTCIGYQFSILEMKCMLFALIRTFEFSPAQDESLVRKNGPIQRPVIKGEEKKGAQLPMVLKVHICA